MSQFTGSHRCRSSRVLATTMSQNPVTSVFDFLSRSQDDDNDGGDGNPDIVAERARRVPIYQARVDGIRAMSLRWRKAKSLTIFLPMPWETEEIEPRQEEDDEVERRAA